MKRAPHNDLFRGSPRRRSLTIESPPRRRRRADADSADSAIANFGADPADSADSATVFFLFARPPGQISPAIGELALAYIRRGIRPAR